MRTVIELKDGLDCPVKVDQNSRGKFRVVYGKQIRGPLNYAEAAKEFGESVFHSLSCAGKLDNSREDHPAMYKAPDVDRRGGWKGEQL